MDWLDSRTPTIPVVDIPMMTFKHITLSSITTLLAMCVAALADCPAVPPEMESATRQLTGRGESGISSDAALHQALYDVIRQEGVHIEGSNRLEEQFQHVLEQAENEVKEKMLASSSSSEDIKSWSSGIIHSYAILQRSTAAPWTAEVCANIVRFDPKNPRFGLPPTVAVFPATARKASFTVEGKPFDPGRLLKQIEARFERTLVDSRTMDVIQESWDPKVSEYRSFFRKRAQDGEISIAETMKLGHQLTADYALTISLNYVCVAKSEKKSSVGTFKQTDADATVIAELVNVATGKIDWQWDAPTRLNRTDLAEAKADKGVRSRMSPEELAVDTCTTAATDSLRQFLNGMAPASHRSPLRVGRGVRIDANKLLTCKVLDPSVRVSDVLIVERIIPMEIDGEVLEDLEVVCVATVDRVLANGIMKVSPKQPFSSDDDPKMLVLRRRMSHEQ